MLIQARLLINPQEIPALGWLRTEGSRIVEISHNPLPRRIKPDLGGPEFLLSPGFIDTHFHFPQFNSIGLDGLSLLEWLDAAIYPAEIKWADPEIAKTQTRNVLRCLLRAGTLGGAGYLTSHQTGVPAIMEAATEIPLRLLAGRVIMDQEAPSELLQVNAQDIQGFLPAETTSRNRLEFSVNPRFAISCSAAALQFAGRIGGAAGGKFLQTHLSESTAEVERVRQLFPDAEHYAGIYDQHGLLHSRTLLAHCNHLTENEWQLLAARNCIAVHCPTANIFLQAGAFDLEAARRHSVRVALGSDIAAGPDLAMPRVARAMIETAKWRRQTSAPNAVIPTPSEVWELITHRNAQLLGWQDTGQLKIGNTADFLLLKPAIELDQHYLGRLIYGWHADWIKTIILNGNIIPAGR